MNESYLSLLLSLGSPTFFNPETEVLEVTHGEEIILNCTAAGNPAPVYSWQSSHLIQEKMKEEAVIISSSLLPGTYTCTVSNMLEKKSKQFIVKAKIKGKKKKKGQVWVEMFEHCIHSRVLICIYFCFHLAVWGPLTEKNHQGELQCADFTVAASKKERHSIFSGCSDGSYQVLENKWTANVL